MGGQPPTILKYFCLFLCSWGQTTYGVHLQRRNNRGFVMSTCTGKPSGHIYSNASELAESILNENATVKFGTAPFFSHELPYDAIVQFNLEDSEWMTCTSSVMSELSGYEKLEVLGLERDLIGNGAHRELSTLLTIRFEEISTCHMVTVEKLQSGVFADKFELDGLVAKQVYTDAQVYGDHNLELPALHSSQSIIVLHKIFSTDNKSGGLGSITQVKVSLPLHARYPPLSMDSHVLVNLGLPYVLFHCSSDNADIDYTKKDGKKAAWTVISCSENFSLESRVLQWAVPAGNPAHTQFVAIMTGFTALIGVLILLMVSSYSFRTIK